MFWKKKPKIDIREDPKFDDNRSAYRIAPDKNKPVILTISGSSYHALNISGTGACFRSQSFVSGMKCTAMVRLPSEDTIFPVKMEIISTQQGLCRCSFINIHEDAENLLHSYILDLQKEKIRQNQSH